MRTPARNGCRRRRLDSKACTDEIYSSAGEKLANEGQLCGYVGNIALGIAGQPELSTTAMH